VSKYYVYSEKLITWAVPLDRDYANTLQNYRWSEVPLASNLPKLACLVNNRKNPVDVIAVTGGAIFLYSERLLNILLSHKVNFDTVEAELYDKNSKAKLSWNYSVFHLVDFIDGLDTKKTVRDPDFGGIKEMFLTKECLHSEKPMVRLRDYPAITLMRDFLMKELKEVRISGLQFYDTENYSHPDRGGRKII
jgi:hypothetical protein